MSISDKHLLYNGWIQSQIFYNAMSVLPTATKSDLLALQTACNGGIRAVWGLPKYGYADISNIRSQLNIPSVDSIVERKLLEAAWKSFSSHKQDLQGPMTRSRKEMKLRHPIQHGNLGKLSSSILTNAWNRLPFNIKSEMNFKQAKNLIKKHTIL